MVAALVQATGPLIGDDQASVRAALAVLRDAAESDETRDALADLAPLAAATSVEWPGQPGGTAARRTPLAFVPMTVPAEPAAVPDDGARDIARAVDRLARRMPEPLQPLARIAYNYRWSWTPGGPELFRSLGAHRFALTGENPVRFLRDLTERTLLEAATDDEYLARVDAVDQAITADLARPSRELFGDRPLAFLCAEFGVHPSLPVYSGGLGVLAGDLMKEASDQALPVVGVGLLYRRGYFHQRVDRSGWQHEYWIEADPETLPAVRVTNSDGAPLTTTVPVWDETLVAYVWRVDVGRVPLYLLDAEVAENTPLERWVSSRLYEGNRAIRLAQYALLGVGAVRVLDAMGIDPALYHLNEGHAALAAVTLAADIEAAQGLGRRGIATALERGRDRFVFTTHTPVPAGNETYGREELLVRAGSARRRAGLRSGVVPGAGPCPPCRRRRTQRPDTARDPRLAVDERSERPSWLGCSWHVARDVPARRHRRGADHPRHERRAPAHVDGAPDAHVAHRASR